MGPMCYIQEIGKKTALPTVHLAENQTLGRRCILTRFFTSVLQTTYGSGVFFSMLDNYNAILGEFCLLQAI